MATYDITSPDGQTFEVTAPDGATEEEVLAYARQHFSGTKPPTSAAPRQPEALDKDGTSYIAQQLKKGVAAGLGFPVDAVTNALNLGIAGYGVAKNKLTGSSDLPGLITDPVGGAGTFERMFLTNNNIQPTGPINRFAGRVVHDLGAAAVPTAAMARYPSAFAPRNTSAVPALMAETQGPLPTLAAGGVLSLLGSTGGETARMLVPEQYKQTADMTGNLLGGVALPAMLLSRWQAVDQLRDVTKPNNVNRMAGEYVEGRIKDDVRNYPGAPDKLTEALALQQEIPGFQPRIGQASGVPSLLDMERRVATAGPQQFNTRAIQDEAQRLAIQQKAEQSLPLLRGNDASERLNVVRSERSGLADALPQTEMDATGRTLRDARSSLKSRADQEAARRFSAPVEEAEKLGIRIKPAGLLEKSDEILSNPLLKWDPDNAPEVIRRVQGLAAKEKGGPALLGPNGEPIALGKERTIKFADLKGLREAVGQDIAREAGNPSSNARQRYRALLEMRDEIDNAAMQAPESVRKGWESARNWYRDEYAPKFLRGINLKQSSRDITGEQRIPDEKLPSQYFKKWGSTPMNRFLTLYGDSPQAMRAMEDHILDTYRREVVKDGVIDPKKHEIFFRTYDPALKQLPETRNNIDSMGNAARLLSEREQRLTETQSLLDRGQLDRLRFDSPDMKGLDPKKIETYLTKYGAAFKDSISETYGARTAEEHLSNLKKIAKAAEIADRGKLHPSAQPNQSTSPVDLKSGFGFTSRTVFNMLRAVTTGRTSSEDMAFTLGMQSATHRIGKALIAAEEKAISDPQTARLIAESMKQPITSDVGQATMRKILEKGGLFVAKTATGSKNYGAMTRYRAAPFAIEATEQGAEVTK